MYLILSFVLLTATEGDTAQKIVHYTSKNIVYYPKQERVILLDSARVSYGDVVVDADSIEYDLQTKTLSAFKNVVFVTGSEKVDGNELYYNLDTKRGFMRDAQTTVENGFVDGKEIWLVKEKTLHIRDGYYTTCDRDPPHYYFYSRRSRVLIDNTAIAELVVLKIFGVPCAAAPFWFFPVSKQRKSGLMPFKFGQSNTDGRYAKGVAYYLVINDYADMTFMLDVMEKKGFQPKLEAVYIVNPFASGQIYASYIRETQTKRERYSINAKHRSQFLFGSNLNAYIDYQSDDSYLPDYAENQIQWLKKEIYSQVSLTRDFKRVGRTNLLVEQKQDFEKLTTEWKLPSVGISFYRLPLAGNWSLSPGISFANVEKKYDSTETNPRTRVLTSRSINGRLGLNHPKTLLGAFDLPINLNYRTVRDEYVDSITNKSEEISGGTGFSTSQTVFQTLNFSEAISYNHSVLWRDSAQSNVRYDFSLNSNLTLFRLFDIGVLGIDNVMHRVIPSLSYNITPQTRNYGIWGLPRFDTIPKSSNIGFSVNNLLQGKFHKSGEKRDLAVVSFNTNYDFQTQAVSPIALNSDLFLLSKPNANLLTNVNLTIPWWSHNKLNLRVSDLTVNSSFFYNFTKQDTITNIEQGIRIGLNHLLAYTTSQSGLVIQSNMVNATMSVIPRGWRFDLSSGINFKEKEKITNYSVTVYKDLHCWEAVVDFNKFGAQWAYDFKVRIKKIPDVSFSKGILGFMLPF
ncbi:MAG: LPS-assembly protein LptD [Candidatus Latescibacteria bacterium]|nr:LPS-assembly protein LptD [Candidatus Latescibacterota bacterium]